MGWLATARLPEQHDLSGGFGQPAVTVYRGDGFIVSILFWVHESVTIHDHRFTGAFSIVDGASLHSHYDFQPLRRLHDELESGVVSLRDVEVLERGAVRRIGVGPELVHSNFHFGSDGPGVSVVVRTVGQPLTTQRFYSQSGLAFSDAMHDPAVTMRLHGFAAATSISPQRGVAFLQSTLAEASPAAALAYLGHAVLQLGPPVARPLLESSCLVDLPDTEFRVIRYLEQVVSAARATAHLGLAHDEPERTLVAAAAAGTPWQGLARLLGSDAEVERVVRGFVGPSTTEDTLMVHPVLGGLFRSRV